MPREAARCRHNIIAGKKISVCRPTAIPWTRRLNPSGITRQNTRDKFGDARTTHLGNVTHKIELGLLHAQGRDYVWNIRQRKGRRQLHRSAVAPAPEPSATATTTHGQPDDVGRSSATTAKAQSDGVGWRLGLNGPPVVIHKLNKIDRVKHRSLAIWPTLNPFIAAKMTHTNSLRVVSPYERWCSTEGVNPVTNRKIVTIQTSAAVGVGTFLYLQRQRIWRRATARA